MHRLTNWAWRTILFVSVETIRMWKSIACNECTKGRFDVRRAVRITNRLFAKLRWKFNVSSFREVHWCTLSIGRSNKPAQKCFQTADSFVFTVSIVIHLLLSLCLSSIAFHNVLIDRRFLVPGYCHTHSRSSPGRTLKRWHFWSHHVCFFLLAPMQINLFFLSRVELISFHFISICFNLFWILQQIRPCFSINSQTSVQRLGRQ